MPALAPAGTLHDGDSYSNCLIERCVFTEEARGLNIARANLRNVRFAAALPAAKCEDVVFDLCDFSNVDFRDAILWRIVFQNGKMIGVNFSGTPLKDTRMEGTVFDGNGRMARMLHLWHLVQKGYAAALFIPFSGGILDQIAPFVLLLFTETQALRE